MKIWKSTWRMKMEKIDEKKLNEMFMKIRIEESTNLRTGKYDDKSMVKQIIKIIANQLKEEKNHEV